MDKISIRNAKFAKTGLQDLINHIGDCSDMIMVEIGSYVGDSTGIFAKSFKAIHAVDPWVNGYDNDDAASYQHDMNIIEAQFDELCKEHTNIIKIKEASDQAVHHFGDGSLDFVYIDGLHTYSGVKRDLELWIPKVKKGGWLGGHDYQKRFPGTIKAVKEFVQPDCFFMDTSWIKKL